MVSLFRRISAVVFGLGGLVFLLIGIVQLSNQAWGGVTGTVQTCTVATTEATPKSRARNVHTCVVAWDAGGQERTHTLELPAHLAAPGCPVDLRVKGDRAALAMPLGKAAIPAVIGLALVVFATVQFVRARRAKTFRGGVTVIGSR
ncbi:hypothetical protein [Actinoplanes missouriensis]|uniref:hypothetical protein n=1 Tax=Actinoplanes missouriensis TaxID=1866 RepID=UPI0005A1EFEE|nr:hypothetical protein [Actinoplanes missouriensis]